MNHYSVCLFVCECVCVCFKQGATLSQTGMKSILSLLVARERKQHFCVALNTEDRDKVGVVLLRETLHLFL